MVGANRTRRAPPGSGDSSTTAPLEKAARASSTTRVISKVALSSGSSQHGKARRASVDSIWVVAMMCSAPASSVKVDR